MKLIVDGKLSKLIQNFHSRLVEFPFPSSELNIQSFRATMRFRVRNEHAESRKYYLSWNALILVGDVQHVSIATNLQRRFVLFLIGFRPRYC